MDFNVLNNLDNGYCIFDIELNILKINAKAQNFLNLKELDSKLHFLNLKFLNESINSSINKNSPLTYFKNKGLQSETITMEATLYEGSVKWLEFKISPLSNTDENLNTFLLLINDVTLEMNARIEQEKLMLLLNDAQKVAKIGSWSYNLITKKIIWSQEMYNIFPEKIEDGPPLYEKHKSTIHPEDVEMWSQAYNHTIENGQPIKFCYRVVHPHGVIWVEEQGHAKLDKNNSPYEVYGTCYNITERVANEERVAIERMKALQSSKMAAVGEMSAAILHEINNPMSVIFSIVSLMKKDDQLNAKTIERLPKLEKSVDRISKIISSMKKFVRDSSHDTKENKILSQIVIEALSLVEHRAKKFDVQVKHEIKTNSMILCDEVAIEQVFINLVNNAIDAVKDLPDRWVQVEVHAKDENTLQVKVTDSGKGLTPEIRKKLFQPYFSTKSIGNGTGLGLSISRDIVANHQGLISIDENSTQTCFVVDLPKAA